MTSFASMAHALWQAIQGLIAAVLRNALSAIWTTISAHPAMAASFGLLGVIIVLLCFIAFVLRLKGSSPLPDISSFLASYNTAVRMGLSMSIAFIVFAVLLSAGARYYLGLMAGAICEVPGVGLLCGANPVSTVPQMAYLPVELPPPDRSDRVLPASLAVCSRYTRDDDELPSLAVVRSVSRDLLFNVSLWSAPHTPVGADNEPAFGASVVDCAVGLRQLSVTTSSLVDLAERIHAEWSTRVNEHAGRYTVRRIFCAIVDRVLEPEFSCSESRLSRGVHASLKESLAWIARQKEVVVSMAAKQDKALLSMHSELSDVCEAAMGEQLRAMWSLGKSWVPSVRKSYRRRVHDADHVKLRCGALRCVVDVAKDAVQQLSSSIDALTFASHIPSPEVVGIKIVLATLRDRNVAILDAVRGLEKLLL